VRAGWHADRTGTRGERAPGFQQEAPRSRGRAAELHGRKLMSSVTCGSFALAIINALNGEILSGLSSEEGTYSLQC
jgi:hypothetical protein